MSLGDAELMNIMKAFKSFDQDGDGSLSREELSNILYRISKGQTFTQVDEEVNDIMEACDKDKSGQISYAEFFSTQKRHDFSPKAQAALDKLTQFMALQEQQKKELIRDNDAHFAQLVREKEEAIAREQRENEAEEERLLRGEHPKHSSVNPSAPKTGLVDEENNKGSRLSKSSGELAKTTEINKDEEIKRLHTELNAAKEQITHLSQTLAQLETNSNTIQQQLEAKLVAADETVKRIEEDREKSMQELERSYQLAVKDLDSSRSINEKITEENKRLKESDTSVEGLRARVRELEASSAELQSTLDLARQQNPDKETDEELAKVRIELSEVKEFRIEEERTYSEKLRKLQAELDTAQEKFEKATQNYTQRLSEEKVARSNAEVNSKAQLDGKTQEIKDLQTQLDALRANQAQAQPNTPAPDDKRTESENSSLRSNIAILRQENNALKSLLEGERLKSKTEKANAEEEKRKLSETQRKAAEERDRLTQERDEAVAKQDEETAHTKFLENTMHEKIEEILQKDGELEELRKEIKQMQLHSLKMSTEVIAPPQRRVEVDEGSPAIVEQKDTRGKILSLRRTLNFFHVLYFVWVLVVFFIGITWAPDKSVLPLIPLPPAQLNPL